MYRIIVESRFSTYISISLENVVCHNSYTILRPQGHGVTKDNLEKHKMLSVDKYCDVC